MNPPFLHKILNHKLHITSDNPPQERRSPTGPTKASRPIESRLRTAALSPTVLGMWGLSANRVDLRVFLLLFSSIMWFVPLRKYSSSRFSLFYPPPLPLGFVLLLTALVCCQPTELILGFFFLSWISLLSHKLSKFTPTKGGRSLLTLNCKASNGSSGRPRTFTLSGSTASTIWRWETGELFQEMGGSCRGGRFFFFHKRKILETKKNT